MRSGFFVSPLASKLIDTKHSVSLDIDSQRWAVGWSWQGMCDASMHPPTSPQNNKCGARRPHWNWLCEWNKRVNEWVNKRTNERMILLASMLTKNPTIGKTANNLAVPLPKCYFCCFNLQLCVRSIVVESWNDRGQISTFSRVPVIHMLGNKVNMTSHYNDVDTWTTKFNVLGRCLPASIYNDRPSFLERADSGTIHAKLNHKTTRSRVMKTL